MVSIYVLKLKYNKYYVGKTTNPTYRLTDHFSEGGSAWTKKYKPITVHELRPDCSDSDEQIITQEYMKKYGIENVRGGPWCQVSLPTETIKSIQHIIQANDDKCYKCGNIQNLHLDHHVPLSKGGQLELGNVVVLCKSCNSSKKDKLPKDWYTKDQLNDITNILASQGDRF